MLTVIVRATMHGATPTAIGLIFALRGTGGLAGAVLTPYIQQRWPPGAVLLALGAVWATLIAALTTTTHRLVLASNLAALSFTIPMINTIVDSYQMSVTPDRLHAQVYASMNLVSTSAAALGSLTSGFLLTTIGSTSALFALTALTITIAVTASTSNPLRTTSKLSIGS